MIVNNIVSGNESTCTDSIEAPNNNRTIES